MKYLAEFRDPDVAGRLLDAIRRVVTRPWVIMVANEGKLVAVVPPERADAMLERMRREPEGQDAAVIGRVTADHPKRVVVRTGIGGSRILAMPLGEQLPRIC